MERILIHLPAYREPELVPTIKSALENAEFPERLVFGICRQFNPEDGFDNVDEFRNDKRFKIKDIPYLEAKGLPYARAVINEELLDDEEFVVQLDSHHRFLQDWDTELIEMMKMTGSEKPIITSYAGMYRPSDNQLLNVEPYKMVASNFTPGGTILFRPHTIENWQTLDKPIPARFVSGHFFFTIGKHCEEYKYDPNIYFAGDEISLSIRSFTLGYDLFHPHKTVVWHEYTREGRTKHWTDFNTDNLSTGVVEKPWWEMDNDSKRRLRHMLQEEDNNIDLGEYGLGNVRTHRDYELYAGINFKEKRLHDDTLRGVNPPINDETEWYLRQKQVFELELDIPHTENFSFIYIGIEDKEGTVIHRQDLTSYEPKLNVSIESYERPHKWVYWVNDINGEWVNRQDILL